MGMLATTRPAQEPTLLTFYFVANVSEARPNVEIRRDSCVAVALRQEESKAACLKPQGRATKIQLSETNLQKNLLLLRLFTSSAHYVTKGARSV